MHGEDDDETGSLYNYEELEVCMAGLHCHVLWRGEGSGLYQCTSPHPSMVCDRAACPNARLLFSSSFTNLKKL